MAAVHLRAACAAGNAEEVAALIAAETVLQQSRDALLRCACRHGHERVVDVLLSHGADAAAANARAGVLACGSGNTNLVRKLRAVAPLPFGAALQRALRFRCMGVVELLLDTPCVTFVDGTSLVQDTLCAAARAGVAFLKLFVSRGFTLTAAVAHAAALAGDAEATKLVLATNVHAPRTAGFALRHGQLRVFEALATCAAMDTQFAERVAARKCLKSAAVGMKPQHRRKAVESAAAETGVPPPPPQFGVDPKEEFELACSWRYTKKISEHLSSGRVGVATCACQLTIAFSRAHTEVTKLLLKHLRAHKAAVRAALLCVQREHVHVLSHLHMCNAVVQTTATTNAAARVRTAIELTVFLRAERVHVKLCSFIASDMLCAALPHLTSSQIKSLALHAVELGDAAALRQIVAFVAAADSTDSFLDVLLAAALRACSLDNVLVLLPYSTGASVWHAEKYPDVAATLLRKHPDTRHGYPKPLCTTSQARAVAYLRLVFPHIDTQARASDVETSIGVALSTGKCAVARFLLSRVRAVTASAVELWYMNAEPACVPVLLAAAPLTARILHSLCISRAEVAAACLRCLPKTAASALLTAEVLAALQRNGLHQSLLLLDAVFALKDAAPHQCTWWDDVAASAARSGHIAFAARLFKLLPHLLTAHVALQAVYGRGKMTRDA